MHEMLLYRAQIHGKLWRLTIKCLIYAKLHTVEDHCYDIARYNKRKEKICIYISTKCTNYGRAYTTNFLRYGLKHKVDLQVMQDKKVMDKKDKA